jgi:hypothetical protein
MNRPLRPSGRGCHRRPVATDSTNHLLMRRAETRDHPEERIKWRSFPGKVKLTLRRHKPAALRWPAPAGIEEPVSRLRPRDPIQVGKCESLRLPWRGLPVQPVPRGAIAGGARSASGVLPALSGMCWPGPCAHLREEGVRRLRAACLARIGPRLPLSMETRVRPARAPGSLGPPRGLRRRLRAARLARWSHHPGRQGQPGHPIRRERARRTLHRGQRPLLRPGSTHPTGASCQIVDDGGGRLRVYRPPLPGSSHGLGLGRGPLRDLLPR